MPSQLAAIAVAGLVLMAACGPASSESAASAISTVKPTSAGATVELSPTPATPGPSPSTGQLRELPPGRCCRGTEVEAGTYRLPLRTTFDLSIDVPPGWRIIREDVVSVVALVRGTNEIGDVSDWLAFFAIDADEPVAAFQADALTMDGFTVVAEPADTTLAGFEGWRVDLAALPNPDNTGDVASGIPPGTQVVSAIEDHLLEGFNWTTATPDARVTILTIEVNGRDLVVYVDVPNAGADAGIQQALNVAATLEVH